PAAVGSRRRVIAKNLAQRRYIEMIREHDLVFAIGPAGTGKTYLAMACAVAALNRREVSRVILTRPAVEAGERLGFLPGTLAEKRVGKQGRVRTTAGHWNKTSKSI